MRLCSVEKEQGKGRLLFIGFYFSFCFIYYYLFSIFGLGVEVFSMYLFVESSSILYACKIYSFHMNNT